jgi:gentisate 1,2-dioxygenase
MASKGPDAHLGHVMRYEDPVDGGWAMPTIAPAIRLVPGGFSTRPYRSSDGAVFVGVEGHGLIEVEGTAYDMAPHDVVVVPGWMRYTLSAVADWVVFSFSDRAAQERLGFFREQRL